MNVCANLVHLSAVSTLVYCVHIEANACMCSYITNMYCSISHCFVRACSNAFT